MTLTARKITIGILLLLISIVLLAYSLISCSSHPDKGGREIDYQAREDMRRECLDLIQRDSSFETIRTLAEKSCGGYAKLAAGGWVAFIYYCNHHKTYDLAIYVDNKGNLLESHYHFCGDLRFKTEEYKKSRERFAGFPREKDLDYIKCKPNMSLKEKKEKWLEFCGKDPLAIISAYDTIDEIVQELIRSGKFHKIK
nr:putative integron gene cassette protein [uncultured bacterium]